MEMLKTPLNQTQLELLKIFSSNIPETDWLEIKRLIVRYFAKKAIASANEVWDKNGWTAEDEQRLLETHMRTPYKSSTNDSQTRH
jgi:hypothetical protein